MLNRSPGSGVVGIVRIGAGQSQPYLLGPAPADQGSGRLVGRALNSAEESDVVVSAILAVHKLWDHPWPVMRAEGRRRLRRPLPAQP